MLVGARAEVCPCVGLRKGYSTKLPLIRRWRCGARVVEEPGLRQPDSHPKQSRWLAARENSVGRAASAATHGAHLVGGPWQAVARNGFIAAA